MLTADTTVTMSPGMQGSSPLGESNSLLVLTKDECLPLPPSGHRTVPVLLYYYYKMTCRKCSAARMTITATTIIHLRS